MITAFCANDRAGYIVSGCKDGEVRVWDMQTNDLISSLSRLVHIASVALSNDGRYVASVGVNKRVVISDLHSKEKFFTTRRAFKHQNNRSCSTTTDNWLRQVATGESGSSK